jgi:hypothetical protein
MKERINDMDTFLLNLEEEDNSLPFTFAMLATQMMSLSNKEKE